ncbi:site-specific DNA-methyltransferase [Evansella halocellulosilytica]|uniref:site-specific DNA-methyltransferase n=1 Tax=Evansella halocellulosilytica TaxID=2011013 RepID=UPI000BB91640|nr:site-specific DNA-methyltransferase [Evansella halocellulosilytica]
MKTKINEAIKQVLQQFGEKYFIGELLNKNKVIRDLDTYDKDLLEAFISNETLKSNFTIDIAGNIVMQSNKLIQLFEADEYWKDSYTKYSKKIGLTAGGKFIDESTDVVLDFPYKDSVLKASMSEEDTDKDDLRPNEPFLNELIAKEEIDVLLDKKILVNAKKYDERGEHEVYSFSEDDNLIMKGNNLLALHTLKEKYAEKVKMIYIDPPYNTKSSATTFHYNNNFNHSTWLTFIKNRVELSKELLRDDGVFVIAIDDNELFYLGVLLDEIFGESNRLGVVSVVHNPGGRQDEEHFPTAHENMIIYAKDRLKVKLNYLPLSKEKIKQFNKKDEYGLYKTRNFRRSGNNSLKTERPKLFYPIYFNTETNDLTLTKESSTIEILPIDPNGIERCWRWGKETFLQKKDKYIEVIERNNKYDLYVKERESDYQGEKPKTIWNKSEYTGQTATHGLKSLFKDKVFSYPKSEFLIKDIIYVCTDSGDLVLDFFIGSGTTPAVAKKMKRQFIGIEQMDYINEVTVPRLQKVIEGEQSGISEDVNWQGGRSFVYVELMEKNRGFLKSIRDARTQTELHEVFDFMLKEAEIDFRVDLEAVKETLHVLSFDDQKKTLIKIIDKNQLYYNYSEIDDENVRDLISNSDYVFNKDFYHEGGE